MRAAYSLLFRPAATGSRLILASVVLAAALLVLLALGVASFVATGTNAPANIVLVSPFRWGSGAPPGAG